MKLIVRRKVELEFLKVQRKEKIYVQNYSDNIAVYRRIYYDGYCDYQGGAEPWLRIILHTPAR